PPPSGGGGGGGVPVSSPVSGSVPAGGSLWSDPVGTAPDASNPLVVGVTSPNGGSVSIDKTAPDTALAHYRVLNVGATISAPAASAADPLRLSFQVFDGGLPDGVYASDLTVFRDGSPVASCVKPGVVGPDPCVTSSATSDGVTTIEVLSSHASTWDVEAAQVGRVAGADRVATAAAVALDSFPDGGAGAVVLARADDFPDALVGAPLAAARNAPLLLTEGAALPKATADALGEVLAKGGTVYVLGGSKAVPDSVVAQLSGLGYQVTRYAGADRYGTAVAVADALGDPSTVLLATGANFPDALAAGPAASHVQGAVLLTDGGRLPAATSAYLSAHAGAVYAVGGPAAKADPSATAVVGADRYATAADVAAQLFAGPSLVGVATGTAFPDALSGGAQLARAGGPLLLATPTGVPAATSGYLAGVKTGLTAVHLFGGPNALTDNVTTQLKNAL
ncbi:MAG TPA: cell wall-binding repeat-containing protein, partial [Acidothermaceae bacterium]|nr:cell wall-binding repeat-containing protein [Acidothermaceae bacterium]